MTTQPQISSDYRADHGRRVPIISGVERVTANNPSAMTYMGTNTYIIGEKSVCVIDPGPDNPAHFHALQLALRGREVSHIIVTHTHRDHSGLALRLQEQTGAKLVAEGRHRLARPLHPGETAAFTESGDRDFAPDITLGDTERLEGDGWTLETVLTPGHAANHAAFALVGTGILFSGDHVMAWASTVIAPPDGSMRDYMASLDVLLARDDLAYLPGHGGPVLSPLDHVSRLKGHRLNREEAILARVQAGDRTIDEMLAAIYHNISPDLYKPAVLSILAHLEDLVARGAVRCEGPALADGRFHPA
ncbi:MBL fold metallo-hydrolase [Agrobacterium vitis]|uniref:MBL fold metallo-hydrolase n=1 Tax=Agrobacterium vitis TaxID=373 RepID=A0AAE2REF9_AGRVI|nr:MBL fold metallo-hydrolase [Agrobacterium vitis]MBF2716903.1 MBL fold metallo-hydrolase [Agrobacterium vitis]